MSLTKARTTALLHVQAGRVVLTIAPGDYPPYYQIKGFPEPSQDAYRTLMAQGYISYVAPTRLGAPVYLTRKALEYLSAAGYSFPQSYESEPQ